MLTSFLPVTKEKARDEITIFPSSFKDKGKTGRYLGHNSISYFLSRGTRWVDDIRGKLFNEFHFSCCAVDGSLDIPSPEGRSRVLENIMYRAYYINSVTLKGKHSGRP